MVSAATRVFATEATRQVTLKRVALEAHVPAQQVTDRWATTTELLTASVDRLTEELAGSATEPVPTRGGNLTAERDVLLDQVVQLLARLAARPDRPEPLPGPVPDRWSAWSPTSWRREPTCAPPGIGPSS